MPGKTIAETLRELIRKDKLSVAAISRKADISQPVLHRFVKGERSLNIETADKLLAYFDLELRRRKRK